MAMSSLSSKPASNDSETEPDDSSNEIERRKRTLEDLEIRARRIVDE
jgi:hypothetical protein